MPQQSTIADDEVERFAAQATEWWNPQGVFAPLHKINPLRVRYIRDQVASTSPQSPKSNALTPFKGLTMLDVGCGGGVLAEPLARLGGIVTGLDAAEAGIEAARTHARQSNLSINYQVGSVEKLAATGRTFDVVTAMEIVEHVADVPLFVSSLARLVKPGGYLIMSTLNRSPKSFLLGIVAAEYILRWVPRGTHQWKKFVRPSELVALMQAHGCEPCDITGIAYDLRQSSFVLDQRDCAVNYLMTARKLS